MDYGNLKLTISYLNRYLRPGSITNNKLETLQYHLNNVLPFLPISSVSLRPAQLRRVSINANLPVKGKTITELKYLKYPPKDAVQTYGRCNIIGQSILYGAFDMITTYKEMGYKVGDLITESTWLLKPNVTLQAFPIFYITRGHGIGHNPISFQYKIEYENYLNANFHPDKHEMINHLMEFLALCFSKEVVRQKHLDYFLSAEISRYVFDVYPEIEMILYPSVQGDLGSSNMAIRPDIFDAKFVPYEILEMVCISDHYPGPMHKVIKSTRSFDLEYGIIRW